MGDPGGTLELLHLQIIKQTKLIIIIKIIITTTTTTTTKIIVNKRDKSCLIIDVAIPKTGWVKEKEDEKAEKYQDYRKSTVQLVKTFRKLLCM